MQRKREAMSEAVVDDIVAVLPPLLQSLEALAYVARHLHPPVFGRVMHEIGAPEAALQAVRAQLGEWPENFAEVRRLIDAAGDATLNAFAGLRDVQQGNGDFAAVIRALRYMPRAQEALYPLAAKFPPVSDFFLDPELRNDEDLKAKLAQPETAMTGVIRGDDKPGSRGSFSLYVPEYYTPDRAWPLVVALHGGSGNGRNFLWSWLRDARSFGAILI